jgi:protein involved in ribonucleotide reduction
MKIVYLSLTGNVRSFVGRVGMDSIELNYNNPLTEVNEDYILITPSYDDEITDVVSEFIDYKNNIDYLIGFVGSGNKNWEKSYVYNAKDLSKKYNKPLIFDFEISGTDNDIIDFKKEVDKIESTKAK